MKQQKTLTGTVVSNKMKKTISVEVDRVFRHKKYGKVMHRSKKYLAHDEKNTASIGDKVQIMQIRPLSKQKRWLLSKIVKKRNQPEIELKESVV